MQTFDYIIVGGGSAGSILASRLSARSANRVLLCEAGADTPDGRVPEPILDSRSGYASRDPRFIWNQLRVTTEAIPHNEPDAPRPRVGALRAGTRARRRLVDQRPAGQSRCTARLRRMGATRRQRLALGDRAALLQEGRARHRFRRTAARRRTAASRCAACFRTTGPTTPRQSPRRSSSRAIVTCRTRTASSRTATTRLPCPTSTTGASPPRSAISVPPSASAKT